MILGFSFNVEIWGVHDVSSKIKEIILSCSHSNIAKHIKQIMVVAKMFSGIGVSDVCI